MHRYASLIFASLSGVLAIQLRGAQKVAVCLSGTARTLTQQDVAASLKTFMAEVAVPGFHSPAKPDLYAYLALQDQVTYSCRDTVNATRPDVERVLREAGATDFALVDQPNETSEDDWLTLLPNRECFVDGIWKYGKAVQAVSQVIHMQKCMGMVVAEEDKNKQRYDMVIVARPDLIYWSPFPANFLADVNNGIVVHDSDHFIAMPRDVADGILPKGDYLINCEPGKKCCGQTNRVEDILEYLLGISVAHAGNCKCAENYFPSKQAKAFDIYGEYYHIHEDMVKSASVNASTQ